MQNQELLSRGDTLKGGFGEYASFRQENRMGGFRKGGGSLQY